MRGARPTCRSSGSDHQEGGFPSGTMRQRRGWKRVGRRNRARPIRGPGCGRCLAERGQSEQRRVVVDAPAGEITPGLLAIGLQRHAFRCELIDQRVELGASDGDGVVRVRIAVERQVVEVGDGPQREVAGPDHERGLGRRRQIERGQRERGGVEHGAGRRDPGVGDVLRAEQHQRRLRRVALLDLDEPLLPTHPDLVEPIEPLDPVQPQDHLAREGGCRRRSRA